MKNIKFSRYLAYAMFLQTALLFNIAFAWDMDINRAHQAISQHSIHLFTTDRLPSSKYLSAGVDMNTLYGNGHTWEKVVGFPDSYKRIATARTLFAWVVEGSGDADIYIDGSSGNKYSAWIQMGFRHFYSPNRKENGPLYLTDWVPDDTFFNPNVNAIDWAITGNGGTGSKNHEYCWNNALKMYHAAMTGKGYMSQNLTIFDGKEILAAAFRALGETLHTMADMGLPCHVRNDGHPTTDTDPLEDAIDTTKIYDALRGVNISDLCKSNGFNWDLPPSPRDMLIAVANFTNENFFSKDTIQGLDEKNVVVTVADTKNHAFDRPNLNEFTVEGNTYYKYIFGKKVVVCQRTFSNDLYANNTSTSAVLPEYRALNGFCMPSSLAPSQAKC